MIQPFNRYNHDSSSPTIVNQDISNSSPTTVTNVRYDENGSKSRAPFHSKAAFHYIKSIVATAIPKS